MSERRHYTKPQVQEQMYLEATKYPEKALSVASLQKLN